jgi:hypothetical protein
MYMSGVRTQSAVQGQWCNSSHRNAQISIESYEGKKAGLLAEFVDDPNEF